jgi:hypothetical protein
MHLLVQLDGVDAALVRALAGRGWRVTPSGACRVESPGAPGVLIGCGNLSQHCAADLADSVADVLRSGLGGHAS